MLTKINNQVVVEWTMHFHLHWYPWEKLAGMFYDKELGPQMETIFAKPSENIGIGKQRKLKSGCYL